MRNFFCSFLFLLGFFLSPIHATPSNSIFTLSAMFNPSSLSQVKHQPIISSIQRDKTTKKATFISAISGKWTLYGGPTVDQINTQTPILTGSGSGEFPLPIPETTRYYFELVTADTKIILADKHLPMQGGFNFRDLGGYQTKDNRTVQWGKIFRSDDLAQLTGEDLEYLSSIPLATVVDFRSPEEIQAAPDKRPQSLQNHLELSISPGNLSDWKDLNGDQVDAIMMSINKQLVSDPAFIAQFRTMFALLQEGNSPLLYHCTAGKDRTGMATALILYALGVDEQTIMDDYLLSNAYILEKFAAYIEVKPQLKGLFSVKEDFLQAGLNTIREEHGSIAHFLVDQLHVDLEKFRAQFLY